MSSVGRWYNIRCYKHNGALHRVWDRGLVLENNSDYIVIASKKAKVVEANGRCWFTKEPAVTIFSKKNGGMPSVCSKKMVSVITATLLPQALLIKNQSNTSIMTLTLSYFMTMKLEF